MVQADELAIQQSNDGALQELALFAGAGGGILGGKLLGWQTVCAVERDAYASQVLAQRQNDGILEPFPIWSDVTTFDGRPWNGIVDVISGGFPCQDISCAGKGKGINGEKSGLWAEMVRIISEIQPYFCFIENSPMLTRRGLDRVLSDIAALGFNAKWGVVGASMCGALHKRERIWVVATNTERVQKWEKSCDWQTRRMGREFKSLAWNRNWESNLSYFRGMDDGMAYKVDRTDAIRNGQVPIVAATAWNILSN